MICVVIFLGHTCAWLASSFSFAVSVAISNEPIQRSVPVLRLRQRYVAVGATESKVNQAA